MAVGLIFLFWGKNFGEGTIKAFGIELSAGVPLLLLALGGGLIVFLAAARLPKASDCLIFCPEAVAVQGQQPNKATVTVFGPIVKVSSGGPSQPNPGCQARRAESCARPEHGGRLLPASGKLVDVSSSGRTGSSVTQDSPDQICIQLWANTSACEIQVSIQGRASAIEEYTPPEQD